MDIEEIKRAERGEGVASFTKDEAFAWLVAEVERLTAENAKLAGLVEEAPKFFSPQHDFDGGKLEWAKRAEAIKP